MKLISIASVAIFASTNVQAEIFSPAPVNVTNGFAIIPQLESSVRYDDNIYNSEQDALSSTIYVIKPSFKFGTDDGINRYGGQYTLESGTYSRNSDDNYVDHNLAFLAHTEFTNKHRLDFKAGFRNTHEARGTHLTELNPAGSAEPLKFNTYLTSAYYQYGSQFAKMRVGAGIAFDTLKYQNSNAADTTKYSDFSALRLLIDSDYQIATITYLTTELNRADITYAHKAPTEASRDNIDTRFLAGLRWEGLAKTTGRVKVGYQFKKFADSGREKFSGSNVDFSVAWQPLLRSTFELHLTRAGEDSDTIGDYVDILGSALSWKHNWTDRIHSNAVVSYSTVDYASVTREDDVVNMAVVINYEFTRWLKVTAGYEFTNKNSNVTDISYDKNLANLGIVIAL
ncbi:outer membrane beta-barrel protein [Psychromonas antarctica]|uniref:outer membrane beta-barrel protein n=1 Tax=Psychromonas antarctica TaxID=67573 RepID=UPI001EE85A4B|nr:outer membrane beta-barrel protein [Psychromonas antarctica]MCG6200436.1 outer membrane beta-barrel protein [Psychromonas antarctica]